MMVAAGLTRAHLLGVNDDWPGNGDGSPLLAAARLVIAHLLGINGDLPGNSLLPLLAADW